MCGEGFSNDLLVLHIPGRGPETGCLVGPLGLDVLAAGALGGFGAGAWDGFGAGAFEDFGTGALAGVGEGAFEDLGTGALAGVGEGALVDFGGGALAATSGLLRRPTTGAWKATVRTTGASEALRALGALRILGSFRARVCGSAWVG